MGSVNNLKGPNETQIFDQNKRNARGCVRSLHQVALLPERVPHPAAGRRSECQLPSFLRAGCRPRYVLVAPILERCRRGVGSEWVPNHAARGRAAFVSSGAGVVGRSHCPLWCSTRSNNTFHSLFDPKCLQVPPRTPMDTPTPDKELCYAKKKL